MGDNCKKNSRSWLETLIVSRPTGSGSEPSIPLITPNNNANMFAYKRIAHSYGLLHKAVHIVIISSDGKNILLQQRGINKKQWKGYWDVVGEHVVKGDGALLNVAKNVFSTELGKTWRKPIYEFDIIDELNYTHKGVTRHDNESKRVYVIVADDIDDNVIKTINNKLEEKNDQETIQFRWFSKEEFDECLLNKKVVPQGYWTNFQSYDNFKEFFREKAKTLGSGPER